MGAEDARRAPPAAAARRRQQRSARRRPARHRSTIDRDTASRLGVTTQAIDDTLYDAFGQRQVSTMYTRLNQYHVVMEVGTAVLAEPGLAEGHLRRLVHRRDGAAVACWRASSRRKTALAVNHQGQFPAVTLSFNLAPGVALGAGGRRHRRDESPRLGLPANVRATFQGTAQAFQSSLANEPMLILAALVAVYIVLGILYESYIHPITILSTLPSAGVGAILALLALRHRPERDRADRHHPADRHRQEERDHDDRLRPRGGAHTRESLPSRRSTKPASCASVRS